MSREIHRRGVERSILILANSTEASFSIIDLTVVTTQEAMYLLSLQLFIKQGSFFMSSSWSKPGVIIQRYLSANMIFTTSSMVFMGRNFIFLFTYDGISTSSLMFSSGL